MAQNRWAAVTRVIWRCQPVQERPSKWFRPRPVFSSRSSCSIRRASSVATGYADALADNPTTNRWRQLSTMDSTRMRHVAVWTGTRLLVWGGQTAQGLAPNHGLAYDPATDRWTTLPPSVLRGRTAANAVWTGHAMLIWGGITILNPTLCTDGATYTPA